MILYINEAEWLSSDHNGLTSKWRGVYIAHIMVQCMSFTMMFTYMKGKVCIDLETNDLDGL